MRIETRSPAGEIRYWLILAAFMLGFAGYFYYDGSWGWPNQNLKKAREFFADRPEVDVSRFGEKPDKEHFDELQRTSPSTTSQVRAALGEPVVTYVNAQGQTVEQYPSRYGVVTVVSRDGLIERQIPNDERSDAMIAWRTWYKPRAEVQAQFYWALLPLAISIWPLWRLARALTLRVTMDEKELVYRGESIPLDDVVAFRGYNPKGWVDLVYRRDGQERLLRLDNQKVAKFDELIHAIAARCKLEDPLAPPPPAAADSEPAGH